ncbi:transporter substrate-binding domain-containing protein [Gilvimarinus sp. SDUM040013]|nr:transporter substrate-binding domain-containing protein [Gilvimarinus sp. SDUM040013]
MQTATAEDTVIRIAVADDFYPFYRKEADASFSGASVEVAKSVFASLGYNLRITQYRDMRSALEAIATGRQDVMINLTETSERAKIALFTTTPHVYETQDIIVRADARINFDGNLLDLASYRIGVIFGWTYGAEFDAADFLTKEPVLDSKAQLEGLLSGQFDVALNNQQYFMAEAKQLGIGNVFKVLPPSVYVLPVNMAVSRKYPGAIELRNDLDRELARFVSSEEYAQIMTQFNLAKPGAEVAQ